MEGIGFLQFIETAEIRRFFEEKWRGERDVKVFLH